MDTEQSFETSDLRHASFCLAREFPFLGADPDRGRVRFRFACSPQEASAYFTPNDSVSARKLFAAWQTLRTLIEDYRQDGGRTMNRSRVPDDRSR